MIPVIARVNIQREPNAGLCFFVEKPAVLIRGASHYLPFGQTDLKKGVRGNLNFSNGHWIIKKGYMHPFQIFKTVK
jgi:hypothetical protein